MKRKASVFNKLRIGHGVHVQQVNVPEYRGGFGNNGVVKPNLQSSFKSNGPTRQPKIGPLSVVKPSTGSQSQDQNEKSTDYEAPEDVDTLCDRTMPYAENWKPQAEKLWNDQCSACGKCNGCE